MTRDELIIEISGKELNYTLVEGAIANMYKEYNINSTVVAYRLLYAFILSYGFFSKEEATKVINDLAINYSTFELSELVRDVVPVRTIEFYEKLVEVEHLTSFHTLTTMMENGVEELEEIIEEAQKTISDFEEKYKN